MRYFLLLSISSVCSFAQTASLGFPALGFAPDPQSNQIRSIRGIPGAAVLGEPAGAAPSFSATAISPKQDLALAVSTGDNMVYLLSLSGQAARPISDAMPAPSHMIFSPSGRAAVIWANRIQVLTDLTVNPRIIDVALDLLAAPTVIALSDDARALLASSARDDSPVWLADPRGTATQLSLPGSVAAMAFRRDSHDAVAVTRSGDVYLVRNAGPDAEIRQVYVGDSQTSDPVAVQLSPDGTRAFMANSRGTVVSINLQTGSAGAVSCQCSPTGLEPLSAPALYRLTDVSSLPVMLFDASTPTPQVWFVPVDASPANQEGSAQ
jgi:hypothetical protein